MNITVKTDQNFIIIKIENSFYKDDFNDFETILLKLLEKMPNAKFIFSLENMPYITSAIIGKFIVFMKKIKERNAKIKFCSLRPQVRNIFNITGLQEVFSVYDDIESAKNTEWI